MDTHCNLEWPSFGFAGWCMNASRDGCALAFAFHEALPAPVCAHHENVVHVLVPGLVHRKTEYACALHGDEVVPVRASHVGAAAAHIPVAVAGTVLVVLALAGWTGFQKTAG